MISQWWISGTIALLATSCWHQFASSFRHCASGRRRLASRSEYSVGAAAPRTSARTAKIQRQRKVGAIKPDIALDLSFMPLIVADLFDFQRDTVTCQNLLHDPGNHPMLTVILIKGQGEAFRASRFFALYGAGMVPTGSSP